MQRTINYITSINDSDNFIIIYELMDNEDVVALIDILEKAGMDSKVRSGYSIKVDGSCFKGPQGIYWKVYIEFECDNKQTFDLFQRRFETNHHIKTNGGKLQFTNRMDFDGITYTHWTPNLSSYLKKDNNYIVLKRDDGQYVSIGPSWFLTHNLQSAHKFQSKEEAQAFIDSTNPKVSKFEICSMPKESFK